MMSGGKIIPPPHREASLSFAQYLKDYTKREHAQLEKKLIGMIRSTRSTAQYLQLLEMCYGYYHALEAKMDQYLTEEQIPDIAERRKSTAILKDIQDLGGAPPAYLPAVPVPAIHSYPQALGAAYVLEGSTLGGMIIAGMIREQLQLSAPEGFAFFTSYGQAVQDMWRKFHMYLGALAGETAQQQAAYTARETFLKFNEWANYYDAVFKV
ncbi:MAG TPA: biliverdin-producing heme oxygenase [Chitinophaga sp.]|uniref:biliverdin-producing heme oxygenase n=1 Tax=Chitinophaga sp. TaxID=1869181 RepID=UPI002DB6AC01|nr:biliverdin-producing heme oxygenase [Chitinophaga sp.]HEU4551978.1 biliverdin-producing heme oxygenase [Chitinophaga sp.]